MVFNLQENYRTWFAFAFLMVLVSGAMYGSTPELLQDTDDGDYFLEAEIAAQDLSHLFSSDRRPSAMGRPVIDVVFLIDYVLWGTELSYYHYQVVFAHFIASLLLTFIFCRFGASLELSFLGALLFLCHVSHFRAVHWIASIGYPLSLIFALLTVLVYLHGLKSDRSIWFGVSALGLCLAILTHPASASVFLFCVYVGWQHTRSVSKTALTIWPLILAAVFCVALSYFVYPKAAQTEAVDTPIVIDRVFETFCWYLSRLITAPHWVFVNFRDKPFVWELAVGALGYGALFWVWLRGKQPVAVFVVWIVVTILPFYNAGPGFRWTPAGPSRHLYFASAGMSLMYAALVLYFVNAVILRWGKTWGRVVGVGMIAVLVGVSIYNDWRAQSVSFYASGRGYVARGDIEVGIAQFKRGIERDPVMVTPDTYFRLVQMLMSRNESPLEWTQKGLAQDSLNVNLIFLEGFWKSLQVQDEALVMHGQTLMKRAFEMALDKEEIRFNGSVAYYNRGIYFYNLKEFEKALPFFEQAVVLNSHYFSAVYHLGQVYWILNRDYDAIRAYQKAIEIEPEYVEPYFNIAKIFLENDRLDAVKQMADVVIGFAPDEPEAYDLLGVVYQAQGDVIAAEAAFLKTLSLDPKMIASHLGLAQIYKDTKPEVAREHYRTILEMDPQNVYAKEGLSQLGL